MTTTPVLDLGSDPAQDEIRRAGLRRMRTLAVSLLLLVAIVGGIIVSRSARQGEQAEESARRLRAIRGMVHEVKEMTGAQAEADNRAAQPQSGSHH